MVVDRIDVLGGNTDRLSVFSGALLDGSLDDELQAITAEAARVAAAPIGLVTLVLNRTQFFRAHYGLPPDLVQSRATDRDVSFCQYVVRDRAPLEIHNARTDERAPQILVDRYGIAAYLGIPLSIGDEVVGALCVVDVKARGFSDEQRAALLKLGESVDRRLRELAALSPPSMRLLDRAASPTFQGLRHLLQLLHSRLFVARVAALETGALVRVLEQKAEGSSAAPVALGALSECRKALRDLDENLQPTEEIVSGLTQGVLALEAIISQGRPSAALREILHAASRLSHPLTGLVGGVRWPEPIVNRAVPVPRSSVISALGAVLCTLAGKLHERRDEQGVEGSVDELDGKISVGLRSGGLTAADADACVRDLCDWIGSENSLSIRADGATVRVEIPTSG